MNITKTLSYDLRLRLFWSIVAAICISFCLYVYAIHATTINIAERKSLESKIAELSARQGTLEFTYIELRNKITLETASQYGLTEVASPLYVSRHNTSLTLANRSDLNR